ncbi:DUF1217 domain-containing protein [Sulfitobacter sabulilitoris]|uniref:DUF1217 domain-containing protein n=1 Tax=Sulfitobacter sabulilitoris TaxID=2562655 RepID=A0A5S3Q6P3_9RHOB|nr:DUF1217 domain-containing protein [Sulfitobacter sabulilitoris]TMM52513.1 DUF1217 domain-containing protein [Sulfitobacter sabulilitoris]
MFTPVIPFSGLAGWRFLQRTYDTQFEALNTSAQQQRATDYFTENIAKVTSAEDLVSDRRLLEVALGAFGLQDDINNRFFIQKILEEGTVGDDTLANRFADPRYAELSRAFGFGAKELTQVRISTFAPDIIAKYQANSFEIAAGAQDETMRVALYAERELSQVAALDASNDTKWFTVMGQPPLRALFEKALNLPKAFGQIDIDQQLTVFKERAREVFGSDDLSTFSDPAQVQDVITQYIARAQIDSLGTGASSTSIALMLLQS